ncbi:MAG: hypothetical protein LUQ36_06565 [Methanoregula sp.]|nr:hypothetical protein [Methanoregula sp.]
MQTHQGASPRHYGAPAAMALYNKGSGVSVIRVKRPRPQRGGRAGAREVFNKPKN